MPPRRAPGPSVACASATSGLLQCTTRHRPAGNRTGPFSPDVVSLRKMTIETAKAGDEQAFAERVEPYPDSALPDLAPGPEARYEQREAMQLAFVVGLQQLPERQRATLVLRDVLGFRTEEVAAMLEVTPQSVKGALQRARATLDERAPARERAPLPDSSAERELIARFSDAVEAG